MKQTPILWLLVVTLLFLQVYSVTKSHSSLQKLRGLEKFHNDQPAFQAKNRAIEEVPQNLDLLQVTGENEIARSSDAGSDDSIDLYPVKSDDSIDLYPVSVSESDDSDDILTLSDLEREIRGMQTNFEQSDLVDENGQKISKPALNALESESQTIKSDLLKQTQTLRTLQRDKTLNPQQLSAAVRNLQVQYETHEAMIASIQADLAQKLINYDLKLKDELKKMGSLTIDDKTKIRSYFNSFMTTYEAAFVTYQAISTGNLKLQDDSITNVLSVAISFVPIVGEKAAKVVNGVGNFLAAIKKNLDARRMSLFTSNVVTMNQVLGGLLINLVKDDDMRQRILAADVESVGKAQANVMNIFSRYAKKFQDKVRDTIFGELKESPATVLAILDANKFIQAVVNNKVDEDTPTDTIAKIILDEPEILPLPAPKKSAVQRLKNLFH